MKKIILTVIVPSYNSEKYLTATLKSIAGERHSQVEYLFVDAGSNDSTMSIVEQYREYFVKIISEPDRGQSDAFNKGFSMARGRFITWLNSDDVLVPGAMEKVIDFLSTCESNWVAANCVCLDKDGRIIKFCRSGRYESLAVNFGLLNTMGPSTFISKELFEKIGYFNVDFHYCMDTEYWWRIAKAGHKFVRMPYYFWGLRLHEGAKTAGVILKNEMPERMKIESEIIRKKFYPMGSLKLRKMGLWIARFKRLSNLSLPLALLYTYRYKGKTFDSIKF